MGGGGCPATAACCGTMRYIWRAVNAVDVEGVQPPGRGCSGDGKYSEPRMAGVRHMMQGWWWKGMETVVQYVSRLCSVLVQVNLLVLKKNQ